MRSVVDQGDGEGDLVADVGSRVTDRLGDEQVGHLRIDLGRVGVVGEVRVELVRVGNRYRVRLRVGAQDCGCDGQPLRPLDQDGADLPHSCHRVVVALGGHGGEELQAAGEKVLEYDSGGIVGPGIGHSDGKGDDVADVGFGVVDALEHDHVRLLCRLGGASGVVGRVRIELVTLRDRSDVVPGAVAV